MTAPAQRPGDSRAGRGDSSRGNTAADGAGHYRPADHYLHQWESSPEGHM